MCELQLMQGIDDLDSCSMASSNEVAMVQPSTDNMHHYTLSFSITNMHRRSHSEHLDDSGDGESLRFFSSSYSSGLSINHPPTDLICLQLPPGHGLCRSNEGSHVPKDGAELCFGCCGHSF